MPKIFISYRRDDSAHVTDRIYEAFAGHFGKENIFKDVDSLPVGRDFRQEIDRVAHECDVMMVVIGPQWLGVDPVTQKRRIDNSGDFVRIEVEYAFERKIPIIPTLVQGAQMALLQNLPESIADLPNMNGVELGAGPRFHPDIERVMHGIDLLFQTPEERQAQAVRQQIAQIEQERRAQLEQEQLAQLVQEREARFERERKDREKKRIAAIQHPYMTILGLLWLPMGAFFGYNFGSYTLHGGNNLGIIWATILTIIGGIIGVCCGSFIGFNIGKSRVSLIATIIGVIIGGIVGGVYGATIGNGLGVVFGVLIGMNLGGSILGFIGSFSSVASA
jgi:hypothetical protein